MRVSRLILAIATVTAVSACSSGLPATSTAPFAQPNTVARNAVLDSAGLARFQKLYVFGSSSDLDAQGPSSWLVPDGKVLYGVASLGGNNDDGAVFSITPSGTETVVHSFDGSDGANPDGLTNIGGTLYGVTAWDGANGNGAIFTISPSGTFTLLHSFVSSEGTTPIDGLVAAAGTMYGTTSRGGAYGGGTLYSLTPSGAVNVVYNYGASGTSLYPVLTPTPVGGMLYGTAVSTIAFGPWYIYSLNPSTGVFTILDTASNGGDGNYSITPLLSANGVLYGTSTHGGTSNCGTIFSVNPSNGAMTTIYNFTCAPDGDEPSGPLVLQGNVLMGTTGDGGTYNRGTLYQLSLTTGQESVLHSFHAGEGGYRGPFGVVAFCRALYGTTGFSGSAKSGAEPGGTVYRYTP